MFKIKLIVFRILYDQTLLINVDRFDSYFYVISSYFISLYIFGGFHL